MLPSDGYSELVALIVVAALVAGSRWVFRPSRRHRAVQRMDAADAQSLGLLTVIATMPRAEAAERREQLRVEGIRASTSWRRDGRFDLLVFADDADRARALLLD